MWDSAFLFEFVYLSCVLILPISCYFFHLMWTTHISVQWIYPNVHARTFYRFTWIPWPRKPYHRHQNQCCRYTRCAKMYVAVNGGQYGRHLENLASYGIQKYLIVFPDPKAPNLDCHEGAEVSASGLKIGRFPVQISPKTNFSIMSKLPVKSTGK